MKKGAINVINDEFTSGRETSSAREVHATQISGTTVVGKHPREEGEMVISFLEIEMEHVTCLHDDALVITIEIDRYNVKKVL